MAQEAPGAYQGLPKGVWSNKEWPRAWPGFPDLPYTPRSPVENGLEENAEVGKLFECGKETPGSQQGVGQLSVNWLQKRAL